MELTESFMILLQEFCPVFTSPSFATFHSLMTGWVLSMRHRYITDLIVSSDSVGKGHYSDYHRFFSHAVWDIDQLWKLLSGIVVKNLFGADATITLAADDTLCRKRGLGLFGAGMHHDPLISSRTMKLVSWGHDWVILFVILSHPLWAPGKVFALPVCMRLYRNRQGVTKGQRKAPRQTRQSSGMTDTTPGRKRDVKARNSLHQTRPDLLSEMLSLVANWFPERKFVVVVDSLYSGRSVLLKLPANIDLIGPVHSQGALYAPAPLRQEKQRGPQRKKGEKLSGRDQWAADKTRWQRLAFDQFGLHTTLQVKERTGLYYQAGKDRLLKFVLSQDRAGSRPTQIYYSTNLELAAREILSLFTSRWAVEVTHHDAKQYLGFDDPANRVPKAVERTAPMAMFLYSLTVIWFAQTGHPNVRFPERPWYQHKTGPSFPDMLTTLRRMSWEEKFATVHPERTPRTKFHQLLIHLATLAG